MQHGNINWKHRRIVMPALATHVFAIAPIVALMRPARVSYPDNTADPCTETTTTVESPAKTGDVVIITETDLHGVWQFTTCYCVYVRVLYRNSPQSRTPATRDIFNPKAP